MAGFSGRPGSKTGSFGYGGGQSTYKTGTTGSLGRGFGSPGAGGGGPSAGPGGPAPPPPGPSFGGPPFGGAAYSGAYSRAQQPQYNPVTVSAPKPTANTNISVTAQRNPQLDALLKQQQQYVGDLKAGTGFASDVASLSTADALEGARNRARFAGGETRAGAGQTRQQQITDAGLRAQAAAQGQMALGREQMVGGALTSQLPTIMGQQTGMLGQQQLGLGVEGLRQQAGRDLFGQQLQGQQLGLQAQQANQAAQNQQFQQFMQMPQYVQQQAQNLQYNNSYPGGYWGY